MKAPTRALLVEDDETWLSELERIARHAGISETFPCTSLIEVQQALREVRFDIAVLDIGLDEADASNRQGADALALIRAADGRTTRVVLVTGWSGDRLSVNAELVKKWGVDWAYMKETVKNKDLTDKLAELLGEQRDSELTPMGQLGGDHLPHVFQHRLLSCVEPKGGWGPLIHLVDRLIPPAAPLIARNSAEPLIFTDMKTAFGAFWSRGLGTAVAVEISSGQEARDEVRAADRVTNLLALSERAELQSRESLHNLVGRLWELPGLTRNEFPG